MPPKFGTSGLRGLVTELTDQLCAGYTEAFLTDAETNNTVLIGRDLRASSPRIAGAVAAGAARLGITPIDCGVLPTPALALAATATGTAAVMITGSHIPDDRNGLKFYTRFGEITKDDEASITARFNEIGEHASEPADLAADNMSLAAYCARFTSFFGSKSLSGLRIGVYEHSSAARELMGEVLTALGADTISLGRADHFIPVDTEAVDADTRSMLAGWAKDHQLDAIVSTDGDADRPMVTNHMGEVVPGDILGPLTARYLGADTVVTPINSNTLMDLMGGVKVQRTRIGSPYVIEGMEALTGHKVVGYEANGGFLLGFTASRGNKTMTPLMTRDSLLPIISPLAAAREAGLTLQDIVDALPSRRTAADRLTEVPTEISGPFVASLGHDASLRETLFSELGELTGTDSTDGFRMMFGPITVHLRPSGNAPEMRIYVEADSTETAERILTKMLDRVGRHVRAVT